MKKSLMGIIFTLFIQSVIAQHRFENLSGNGDIKSLTFHTSNSLLNPWTQSYVDIELFNGNIYNDVTLHSPNELGFTFLGVPNLLSCSCSPDVVFSNQGTKMAFYDYHPASTAIPGNFDYWVGILIRTHENGLCINIVGKNEHLSQVFPYNEPSICFREQVFNFNNIANGAQQLLAEIRENERLMHFLEISGIKIIIPPKPACLSCPPYKDYINAFPERNKFFEENIKKELNKLKKVLEK